MDEEDIVVFILWSFAAPQRARIVDDLRTKFDLLEAWRITWDPARFAQNLRRLIPEARLERPPPPGWLRAN